MSIAYRITKPELCLLADLLSENQERFLPEMSWDGTWRETAFQGLTDKGYLNIQDGAIVLNRVMSGLIRAMIEAEKSVELSGDRKGRIYIHSEMLIVMAPDHYSRNHYKLIPFENWERLKENGYCAEEESTDE